MRACLRCSEEIQISDPAEQINHLTTTGTEVRWMHLECLIRGVVGSVGHLMKKCPCYGGTEEDPEGLSKRDAARVALEYFRLHHMNNGETDA